MLKKIVLLGLFILVAPFANAQMDERYSHLIGVQANPLFNQILSFGNAQTVDNPFLLRYSLRDNENSVEYSFGIGYSFNSEKDENGLEAINNTINTRLGWFRIVDLGKGLELALGGDIVYGTQNIKTFNIQAFNFGVLDSTITTSTTSNSSYGFGPRIKFSWSITSSLSIGTESNYYFRFINNKTNVLTKSYQGDGLGNITTTTNTENVSNTGKDFQIDLPIALFLILRF
tara:strand:- start:2070 stop:2759 length:690 start_codon:yes stop_codon:yes gene_type:complete